MANINLLPWRDAQRRERNRQTLLICIAMWLFAALIVFVGKSFVDMQIDNQKARNKFLQNEIDALSKVIKEIEDIKQRRDELIARMEVIQNLQKDRSRVVHVFDDLANKQPEGVFYDSIQKRGIDLSIKGKAQSNNRVSSLMRLLDSSDWLKVSDLKDVGASQQNAVAVSQFDMIVKEQVSDDDSTITQVR